MSIENGEQGINQNDEPERHKLSFTDLHGAMIDYLYGTVMLAMLARINLEADSDGNVAPQVIDNLKIMLRKASDMTPDEVARVKFDNMLAYLAPF